MHRCIYPQIDDYKPSAQILEKRCPSPMARGNLEDRVGRDKGTDARQNGTIPLHIRGTPSLRPLFTSS